VIVREPLVSVDGAVNRIVVAVFVEGVTATVPSVTVVTASRLVPVIVTTVPPVIEPAVGETDVMVGGA
jgi:hypothetical protein